MRMNYREIMLSSADYIENHLKVGLSVELLAKRTNFSSYHYYRLFTLFFGIPVMEYIRKRRLAHAAAELSQNRRIIDIAIDYGFETHNGFAKAFRKTYGFSPGEYRKRVSAHRPLLANPIASVPVEDRQQSPVFRIEEKEGFFIAGFVLRTETDVASVSQMPALWNEYRVYDYDNKLYALVNPKEHGEYNICFPDEGKETFSHVNCVKVSTLDGVDAGLYTNRVPAATYAVFTSPPTLFENGGFVQSITRTWEYIYDVWLPDSGYMIDQSKLDFEFYDERCHGNSLQSMEIYVPVIKK